MTSPDPAVAALAAALDSIAGSPVWSGQTTDWREVAAVILAALAEKGWTLAPAARFPTSDAVCGAMHPEHPGTHCRRKPGHGGDHATARYDVQWAALDAAGEGEP